MKVVFLEDVPNVAKSGDTKEVADGYGRNYLLPRKLAILANSQATGILQAQLRKRARLQAQTEVEMRELAQQLEGKEIVIKARAGASDRLYGSITSADIVEELSNSTGLVVDKRKIELDEPIRQIGSYEIALRLTKDIIPRITLTVVEEGGEEKKEKEAEGEGKKGKEEKKEKEGKKEKEAEGEKKEETE